MRAHIDLYLTQVKTALASMFQYRISNLLWLVAMVVEPVVYLVVWSSVARQQGGSVAGYTPGAFAAYYITWTLVRQMNIALTPYAFESRVRKGELSPMLLRPMHPFHFDLAWFMGFKIVTFVLWLPIALVLTLAFRPTLDPTWWQVVAFLFVLVSGFVMRFVLLWVLGLVTFWVTRVSAVFELYFTVELLLSGRLVPLDLLPPWARSLADWLPFQWTFGYPIEVLLGRLSVAQTLWGMLMQAVWFAIGAAMIALLWRPAVRKYSAVGA
jgi:ABC-2 type transport system permease protein